MVHVNGRQVIGSVHGDVVFIHLELLSLQLLQALNRLNSSHSARDASRRFTCDLFRRLRRSFFRLFVLAALLVWAVGLIDVVVGISDDRHHVDAVALVLRSVRNLSKGWIALFFMNISYEISWHVMLDVLIKMRCFRVVCGRFGGSYSND